eukprot:g75069.t1
MENAASRENQPSMYVVCAPAEPPCLVTQGFGGRTLNGYAWMPEQRRGHVQSGRVTWPSLEPLQIFVSGCSAHSIAFLGFFSYHENKIPSSFSGHSTPNAAISFQR